MKSVLFYTQFNCKRNARRPQLASDTDFHWIYELALTLALIFLLLPDNTTYAANQQQKNPPPDSLWQTLAQVQWKSPDLTNTAFGKPQFSVGVKALHSKTVTISGYVIPTDLHSAASGLILSAYPVQSCFFCGGAGPESVIEVHPKKKQNYLSRKLTFRGTLLLNDTDPNQMIYQLKNAERVFTEE